MTFHSILSAAPTDDVAQESATAPGFFTDLNLDQVVEAATVIKQEYDLPSIFYTPLSRHAAIQYRQELFRDLENSTLLGYVNSFAKEMQVVRRYLGLIEKLYYHYHKEGWLLETIEVYCQAVTTLADHLAAAPLQSAGFCAFREYLQAYTSSEAFMALLTETTQMRADLATVSYTLIIKEGTVKVRKYEGEIDYSADVEETFAKFKQGAVKDYLSKLTISSGMNHVEAKILGLVAKLFPEIFAALDAFCARHKAFLDDTIRRFDREIQFYVAYLEYIAPLQRAGLKFCYPQVIEARKEVSSEAGFDLALAAKCVAEDVPVVTNDFCLQGEERVLVVTGPNQGGKTTFARTFGQLHYLARLGCPVPGRRAQLFLADQILTHFEREENIHNLRGKLQDDLVRIHAILEQATPLSVLVMNEIFSSTTLEDAIFLSQKVMERIVALDLLAVWVTFVDEMASFGKQTVSMVSTVVPENPAERTYKIVRKPADGLAYAMSLAEKHGLTYQQIVERIAV